MADEEEGVCYPQILPLSQMGTSCSGRALCGQAEPQSANIRISALFEPASTSRLEGPSILVFCSLHVFSPLACDH